MQNGNLEIAFAAFAPHPPIILPDVGSLDDRKKVKNTIASLNLLGKKLTKINPDLIIISSPHPSWGFEVPLCFLNPNLKTKNPKLPRKSRSATLRGGQSEIQNYQSPENIAIEPSESFMVYPTLTTLDPPKQHFEWGKNFYLKIKKLKFKIALVASGDTSHVLKDDGPYGLHPDGPKFDNDLMNFLKTKNIEAIFDLDNKYPQASECGLRSFCFILGILDAYSKNCKKTWQIEILSYEYPFGVGYLTADFNFKN